MKKIWVLLSVENEYDQPPANLEAWWIEKPSFKQIADVLNIGVDVKKGHAEIGRILKGKDIRVTAHDTDYRLECIEEGIYKQGE